MVDWKTTFQELKTAKYDSGKDEIIGCENRTLAWYHEDRHRQQYHNSVWSKALEYSQNLSTLIGFGLSIGLAIYRYFGEALILLGLFTLPYCIVVMLMEVDAWIYSLYKVKES